MSRARSKTVDTAEVKKNGLPRRLNEKIALMKKKELAQSQAFEQAMQSIFEMQQAQLHSGGGSMPSLQNIDSSPPNPFQQMATPFPGLSLDKTSCMTTPTGGHQRERLFSGRTTGLTTPPTTRQWERPTSGGTTRRNPSVERTLSCGVEGLSPSYPLADTTSWNIHKSESDLSHSLAGHMTTFSNTSFIQNQTPPTFITSSTSSHNGYTTTEGVSLMTRNDHNQEMWRNTQFSSGIGLCSDNAPTSSISAVLLSPDHSSSGNGGMTDSTHIGSASSLPDLTNIEFSSGLDVPIEKDDDSPTYNKINSFHFPSPGPSKLTLSSITASSSYNSHSDKLLNSDVRSHPYFQSYPSSGRVPRSPTMPDFQSHTQLSAPPIRKYKHHQGYQTPPLYNDCLSMLSPDKNQNFDNFVHQQITPPINAPFNGNTYTSTSYTTDNLQQTTYNGDLSSSTSLHHYPNTSQQHANYRLLPPSLHINNSLLLEVDQQHVQQLPNSPAKPPSLASTSSSSGYISLPPYLDPGTIMYQQRTLQQRLAGISVCRDNQPLRSHSEENLIKMQKDLSRDGIIQQNPFMGNMSNASSVPCVYVESTAVEPCVDEFDSYTTGTGSPSTSASHASSPPMLRPDWIDHPHTIINEFVFQDWPLESNASLTDKVKFGSPLSHHKSLTELNKAGDNVNMDLSPNFSSRAHQLSLPSIVMGDLITMDEHNLEKQGSGPFLPSDFDMEEEVMESLLRNDQFVSFDVNNVLGENGEQLMLGGNEGQLMIGGNYGDQLMTDSTGLLFYHTNGGQEPMKF